MVFLNFAKEAHLEHFVAEFNLPVFLLCWVLTDVVNIPVDKTSARRGNLGE